MKTLWIVSLAATAILAQASPAIARPAPVADPAPVRQKQWLPANFRMGPDTCAIVQGADGFALSASGQVDFTEDNGLDVSVSQEMGQITPSVTALAIKTKGTSAHRTRGCTVSAGDGQSDSTAARCAVSGDPDAPMLRFTVPLAAISGVRGKPGHVTLLKRTAADAPDASVELLATCDTTGLTASLTAGSDAKEVRATYDLATNKKV